MGLNSIVGVLLFLGVLQGAEREHKDIESQVKAIKSLSYSDPAAALSKARHLQVEKNDVSSNLKVLNLIADLYCDDFQFEKAQRFYRRGILLADSTGHTAAKFEAMCDLADVLSDIGAYDSAITVFQKVLLEADISAFPLVRIKAFMRLGDILKFNDNVDLGYSYYLKARDILLTLGKDYLLEHENYALAEIYLLQKNYSWALDYLEKSIAIAKANESGRDLGYLYSRMGNIYESLDIHDRAHIYFDSALVMFKKTGYRKGIANTERKLGKTFRRKKHYDSARVYFIQALGTMKSMDNKRHMSMIYRQLSIVERKRGQLEAALHYALQSIEMAEETTNLETYYQASREVAEVYQSTGDYKTAYEYEKRLAETKRQQLSSIFDQQLGDMEAYIELEKNLLHKKQEFDQLELLFRKRSVYLMAVIIGLLGLFIVFAYRQYVKDIARMRKIELQNEAITQKNQQIANHMSEFKKFAYVSSHDLKGPLRGISNISEWLKNDYAKQLDPKGTELFELLKSRVHKMEYVLNGVVAYFKIDSDYVKPVDLDVKKTIERIQGSMILNKTCYVQVNEPIFNLNVDRHQFNQVMFNLIDNGCRHNEKPFVKIEVGFTRRNYAWHLYVKDNGEGIEEKHYDKIFEMFQALSNSQDEGHTGMGLAIVKKIVESWNCEIIVESELGQGSIFYIQLHESMLIQPNDIDYSPRSRAV